LAASIDSNGNKIRNFKNTNHGLENHRVFRMLFITHQKERFNAAYVESIAAHAGINTAKPEVDNDSVDITLIGKGFVGGIYENPHIDLQLKCTHVPSINNGRISFSLKKKNYDDLRKENVIHPRYLVVMIVDKEVSNWADYSNEGLLLRGHCYWVSIKGAPDIAQEKVTVYVPLSQVLTSDEVIRLLNAASRRIEP
jgi:hypothetical protein